MRLEGVVFCPEENCDVDLEDCPEFWRLNLDPADFHLVETFLRGSEKLLELPVLLNLGAPLRRVLTPALLLGDVERQRCAQSPAAALAVLV